MGKRSLELRNIFRMVVICFSVLAFVLPALAVDIEWLGYEDGMAKGKSGKKKIFLSFYADWCTYCKVMDSTTFKDDGVVKFINENFVAIRINSDQNRKLASDYNVRGLPMTWFVSEEGENIGGQPGYIPPDMLMPIMKYIQTDSYKKMNFAKFKESL